MFRHVPPGHILHDLQQLFMRVRAGKRQLSQDLAVALAKPMGLIGPHWASWVEHEHTVRGPTPTWLWIASGNS